MRLSERNAALRKRLAKRGVVGVFMYTDGRMEDLTVNTRIPRGRGKLFSCVVGSEQLVCCGERN
jgi:hypothetical protein